MLPLVFTSDWLEHCHMTTLNDKESGKYGPTSLEEAEYVVNRVNNHHAGAYFFSSYLA